MGDYPVAALESYKALAEEGENSSRTKRRLEELAHLGLVKVVPEEDYTPEGVRDWSDAVPKEISPRGQGKPRYKLTDEGMLEYVKVNGGLPERLASRTRLGGLSAKEVNAKEVSTSKWALMHEDFCYEILIQFFEMSCPIAPGWQVRITLADGSHIDPDGAVGVYIRDRVMSWCYLEVELSDRTPTAAEARCKRYASKDRLDDSPVLFVVYNDTAERNFHAAGRKCGLEMLFTTTLKRLADSKVGGEGVWSHYGTPVTLSA